MKSEYIEIDMWGAIAGGMTSANARAIAVSLETGLRIGDVLQLEVYNLLDNGISYTAQKTGKAGFAPCSEKLLNILRDNAVNGVCFPSRSGAKGKYRSRQAVWKDTRKAVMNAGLKAHISPHSARKSFAVDLRRRKGVSAVQAALQHRYGTTTNEYAFADLQGMDYGRDRIVNEAAAKVLERLSDILGIDLTEKPPKSIDFCGEDDL